MPKRMLELFCGTKSVGNEFRKAGYEIVSLDFDKKFNATHVEDILNWDYTIYPPYHFDVIWASPDCTTWSVATGGKYRLKKHIYGLNNEYQPKATVGNNMILRLIEIIKYFGNVYWYIENPRGLLIHFPPLVDFIKENGYNNTLVYYGNYNWGFPKATHIWSNLRLWRKEDKPLMPEDTYTIHNRIRNNVLKEERYYKAYSGTSEYRSKIPPDLVNRLRRLIPDEI